MSDQHEFDEMNPEGASAAEFGSEEGSAQGADPVSASEAAPIGADDIPAADENAQDISAEDLALLDETRESMGDELAAANEQVATLTDELARARADYVNYRNRIERERAGDRDVITSQVIDKLLPALDDLDRAKAHGDLDEGPLAIVADKLAAAFGALGVQRVGEVGEVFDVQQHEIVATVPNPEVTELTVFDVVQAGYRVGDRLLRAAKVAVHAPAEPTD